MKDSRKIAVVAGVGLPAAGSRKTNNKHDNSAQGGQEQNTMNTKYRLTSAILSLIQGVALTVLACQATAQTDIWVTKSSIPTVRRAAGVGVINGTLYIAGGYAGASDSLNTV